MYSDNISDGSCYRGEVTTDKSIKSKLTAPLMNPRSLSWTRIISQLNACYTTPVTAAGTHTTALKLRSPQQYIQTERGWDLDSSRHQQRWSKMERGYLRRPRKGYPRLQGACQIQIQVQSHAYHRNRVLPPESLAKGSGCGQRGTLERKCIGSLVDSGSQSIMPINS